MENESTTPRQDILSREAFKDKCNAGATGDIWVHDAALRAALATAQEEIERLKRVNQSICKHAKYWIDVFESSPHDEGCGIPIELPPVEEYTDEILAKRPCTCRKARIIKDAALVLELPLVPSLESSKGSMLPQIRYEQALEIQRLTAEIAAEREINRQVSERLAVAERERDEAQSRAYDLDAANDGLITEATVIAGAVRKEVEGAYREQTDRHAQELSALRSKVEAAEAANRLDIFNPFRQALCVAENYMTLNGPFEGSYALRRVREAIAIFDAAMKHKEKADGND